MWQMTNHFFEEDCSWLLLSFFAKKNIDMLQNILLVIFDESSFSFNGPQRENEVNVRRHCSAFLTPPGEKTLM